MTIEVSRNKLLTFQLNGAAIQVEVPRNQTLLECLRETLDLTGTKKGCDNEGQCGACTVLLNDRPVRACLTPTVKVSGQRVTTIEGLTFHPLQQAFVDHGAVQCGYCTPGMLMSAVALISRNPTPAQADIAQALQGNLCRCTGYVKIIQAVQDGAARLLQKTASPPCFTGVIGHESRRLTADDIGKVTGNLRYASDIKLPGMLMIRVLRSPHHYARILRLNTAPAKKLAGVTAVITTADIPGQRAFSDILDDNDNRSKKIIKEPVLADQVVRMLGEPIALVIGTSETAAQAGVEAIEIDYEPLPPVHNPNLSDLITYETDRFTRTPDHSFSPGDEIVIETTCSLPSQDHVTMEPGSAIAFVDDHNRLVVKGPTQQPHVRKQQIAAMLNISPNHVRVIVPEMGGSFGGWHYFWPILAIALPAYLLRRPVKYVYSRREAFEATTKRHAFQFDTRISAGRDGQLHNLKVTALGDAGPYGGAPGIAALVTQSGIGPYLWPGVDFHTRIVHTNGPHGGAFRGYGMPQGAFALETALDELAVGLNLDPLELRLLNAADQQNTLGLPFAEPFVFKRVLETVRPYWAMFRDEARRCAEHTSSPHIVCGAGLAASWYRFSKAGATHEDAQIKLGPDGKITLYFTALKAGQGLATVMSQLAAHELGVPQGTLTLINSDTDLTPYSQVYGGSRSAYWVGGAVQCAARALKDAILSTAAEMLDVNPAHLHLTPEAVSNHNGDLVLSLQAIAAEWKRTGQRAIYTGRFMIPADPSQPLGHFVSGVALATVQVNRFSGQVKVRHILVAQDVGRVLNPLDLQGQIEGAVMMELGATLMEQYIHGETSNFKQYNIPRIKDTPKITVIPLEGTGQDGPHQAKGLGEAVMGHIRAAITNAIFNATGIRVRRLPVTPGDIKSGVLSNSSGKK
jgi:aldehyde oxidoreductase